MKLSTNQISGYLFETTITLNKANLNNLSKQVQNQANIK